MALFQILLALALAATSGFAQENNLKDNPLYHVGNRTLAADGKLSSHGDKYLDQIQPILNARCVACHGCFEAPCQLNLQSYEGLRRGYNPEAIYAKRPLSTYPTRLIDAKSVTEWRAKNFLPVVDSVGPEREITENSPQKSILYQLLDRGEKTNVANFAVTNLEELQKFMDDKSQQVCVATDRQFDANFSGWRKNRWGVARLADFGEKGKYGAAGMPFGFHAAAEQAELKAWVASGAPGPSPTAQAALQKPSNPEEIQEWEDFLNNRSNKGLQVGRYIYEHVYTAHILFKANPGEFFFLVRSKTKTGPIDQMVTQLPYDPPTGEVFYRFQKITGSIAHKNHFLWELDDTKLKHLNELFFDTWKDVADNQVPAPRYQTAAGYTNGNPFEYFESIPAKARARFMIENSRIIVAAMTQGSVCVGTTATFAINDHFWGWFLKPESDVSVLTPKLGLDNWEDFATTNIDGELIASHLDRTLSAHRRYEAAYEVTLREMLKARSRAGLGPNGLAVSDLWTGDGDPSYPQGNPNAWLNITRHEKSATVQYGPDGGKPHSIWVVSYSNFERLYYNLVASFKEWGSLDHKAATWRHMSYVRMEGEDLAISFLPLTLRKEVRNRFSRGVAYWRNKPYPHYSTIGLDNREHFTRYLHKKDLPPREAGTANTAADADQAISNLVSAVKSAFMPTVNQPYSYVVSGARTEFERQLNHYQTQSQANPGQTNVRALPSVAYVRVENAVEAPWVFTLIRNRAYEGHNDMLIQRGTPEYDTLSVYRGFVGGYPNIILNVAADKQRAFIVDLAKVGTPALSWKQFRKTWALARNLPTFWNVFDNLNQLKATGQAGVIPEEQGIPDLSQYEIFN